MPLALAVAVAGILAGGAAEAASPNVASPPTTSSSRLDLQAAATQPLCDLEVQLTVTAFYTNGVLTGTSSDYDSSAACDINMTALFTQVTMNMGPSGVADECTRGSLLHPQTCRFVESAQSSGCSVGCAGTYVATGNFELVFPAPIAEAIAAEHPTKCRAVSLSQVNCQIQTQPPIVVSPTG